MEEFECLKDWKIKDTYYFNKGKTYKGERIVDGSFVYVQLVGNADMTINFHPGNEYFSVS